MDRYKVDNSRLMKNNSHQESRSNEYSKIQQVQSSIQSLKHFSIHSRSPNKKPRKQDAENIQEDSKLITRFNPSQYLNLDDAQVQQALRNLGIQRSEFEKELVITDYYDIRESREMQIRRFYADLNNMNLKIQAVMMEIESMKKMRTKNLNESSRILERVMTNRVQEELQISKFEQLQRKIQLEVEREKKLQQQMIEELFNEQRKYREIEEQSLVKTHQVQKNQQKFVAEKLSYINRKKKEQKEKEKLSKSLNNNNERDEDNETLEEKRFKDSQGFMTETGRFLEKRQETEREFRKKLFQQDQQLLQSRIKAEQISRMKTQEVNQQIAEKEKEFEEKFRTAEEIKKRKLIATQNNLKKYGELLAQAKLETEKAFEAHTEQLVNQVCHKYERGSRSLEKIKSDHTLKIKKIKMKNNLLKKNQSKSPEPERKESPVQILKNTSTQQQFTSRQQTKDLKRGNTTRYPPASKSERQLSAEKVKLQIKQQSEKQHQEYLHKELERKHLIDEQNKQYFNFLKKQQQVRFNLKYEHVRLENELLNTLKSQPLKIDYSKLDKSSQQKAKLNQSTNNNINTNVN